MRLLVYPVILFCVINLPCSLLWAGFDAFNGDERDQKEIVGYLNKHKGDYFKEITSVKKLSKRRELQRLKAEMQRLVLKIDAGDIKNDKLRAKIVAMRRGALKNRNRERYIIDDFDHKGKNRLGGKRGFEYAGKVGAISPWINSKFIKRTNQVNNKVIQLQYDIQEGDAAFYEEIVRHYAFKRYNALQFDVKGDANALVLKLECGDKICHEYILSQLQNEWQTVIVPFGDFSAYDMFNAQKIDKIHIVLDDDETEKLTGTICIDNFSLTYAPQTETTPKGQVIIRYDENGSKGSVKAVN